MARPTFDHRLLSARLGRRGFLGGAAVLGGAVLLNACGDDDDDDASSATTGAGGASATTAAGAGELAALSTVFSWVKNVEWAGWYIADAEGYFAEEGIAAELVGGGPNAPENVQVLEAGQAELGTASDILKIFDAASQGADFVMLGAVLQQSPLGLCWLDPAIATPEDLIGKRIGGDEDSTVLVDAMFAVNGLEPDYEFVPIGFDPAPLPNGEVDAIVCFVTNQPTTLQLQGLEPISATLTELGFPLYADAIIAKRPVIDEHHDAIVRYLRGVIKGWERNMLEPDLGVRLAVEEYGVDLALDAEAAAIENEKQIELQQSPLTAEKGLLWMDLEEIEGPMYEAMRATGREELPAVADVVDLSLLEEAYDGATSLL
jgi:ABC-type nitrate/sulfonate/bicarbonate transport system substrate-binding protein